MAEVSKRHQVIIIGGGAAGLSAALYLSRAGLKPLVFAGSPPGGQLMLTTEVENFPGTETVLGPELIDNLRKQVVKFGTTIIDENVASVTLNQPAKLVTSASGTTYQTKSVIIATGARALWLGLESETRLRGKGVSACATCDGFFFRNKTVAVLGGGDSALEEAMTLSKFASKVYIVHRRSEFKASKIMQKRVFANPKIHEIFNAVVEEIKGTQRVEGLALRISPSDKSLLTKSKEEVAQITPALLNATIKEVGTETVRMDVPVDGVFVAIGHRPDTDLFKEQIMLDAKGYVLTTSQFALAQLKLGSFPSSHPFDTAYQTMTSKGGVFGAGDCVDHVYKQASTAAGLGVQAALDAERWLETQL